MKPRVWRAGDKSKARKEDKRILKDYNVTIFMLHGVKNQMIIRLAGESTLKSRGERNQKPLNFIHHSKGWKKKGKQIGKIQHL